MTDAPAPHHVVVIGSGFGGLFATKALARDPVRVTVLASTGHHLFQPLLYQVATGVLSEGEIAPATRDVLRRQRNARVLLGTVTDIDLQARVVTSRSPGGTATTSYDSLVVAAGAGQSYFGNDGFAEHAPGLKSVDDALELRGRIFGAFELAELSRDPAEVRRLLTFVVVGAGPTGVEMAGQIAELAHRALAGNFRHIDPAHARIVLADAAPAVLPTFAERLGRAAARRLEELGVEVMLDAKVVGLDETGVDFEAPDGSRSRVEARCKVWAAGVAASPLGALLAEQSGAETDRVGRVRVEPDCSLPGHPEVFVVGDLMALDLPGVAQVAMQSGQHAAGQIRRRLAGEPTGQAFAYRDKGSMATVSRFHAVAQVGSFQTAGLVAWVLWLAVHLVYLVGFKNRLTTLLHWTVSFVGRGRSERTATLQQVLARRALDEHERALGDQQPATQPRPDPGPATAAAS
ncbi:NAD(P)/FAD-dependent oxidoreductase [Cellulomonas cellasea]|uniref:NADH:ubiquinone reductase (non-electrogenic) n=2 Tax=Cellulomonas cellasea TaxID=43670 RepID=A0A0A0BCK3_9CELL|nr:NAD(P)/FAD-dependent oxidoreductase [Cellulomonas cellasea]KGM03066.1 NADH dehydrogenase [Cellulomonas cellasea DSM 20118]GEA90027.1 putative NADH dehydrogenase (NDH) [Cellulomonas cellasea]